MGRGRWLLAALVACSFRPDTVSRPVELDAAAPGDAGDGGPVDAPVPDAGPVCDNGALEPGEACEIGDTMACTSPCGGAGTRACTRACTWGGCAVDVAATGRWEVAGGLSGPFTAVDLPHTAYGCTNCTRHYVVSVCERPVAVSFRWASDNRARMFVNGAVAFDDFWLAGYCTDAPCCAKCCDTPANCLSGLSAVYDLDAAALARFGAGANQVRWEVNQEVGGSGFHVLMRTEY